MPSLVEVSPPVSAALRSGAPVVALESTIISHGLPRPGNLDAAREFEAILVGQGVTAATIALIDGVPRVGLTPDELERIATDESAVKVSSRDIAIAVARKVTGGTTVAATSVLAARAGIRVFATGGLGGVHRGASETFDESADLTVLSRTPITVVSAGVKSILDIPATLERLETLGVAVVGYRTSRFPAFWLSDSGCDQPVPARRDPAGNRRRQRRGQPRHRPGQRRSRREDLTVLVRTGRGACPLVAPPAPARAAPPPPAPASWSAGT